MSDQNDKSLPTGAVPPPNDTRHPSGRLATFTGRSVWPLDPAASSFCIEDIAHALANVCRFGGHCRAFYSVAQHSVLVSRLVPPELALAGLLHDAAEAYVGDVPRPIKATSHAEVEHRLLAAILVQLDCGAAINDCTCRAVKDADNLALATERASFDFDPGHNWPGMPLPLAEKVVPLWPVDAESQFLARFRELTSKPPLVEHPLGPVTNAEDEAICDRGTPYRDGINAMLAARRAALTLDREALGRIAFAHDRFYRVTTIKSLAATTWESMHEVGRERYREMAEAVASAVLAGKPTPQQQAGPVAQALEAYRVARAAYWKADRATRFLDGFLRDMCEAKVALDAALDAEATSTTPDADASAIRGAQAGETREVVDQVQADTGSLTFTVGGELMYPATQFAAMRERAEKAETKWRDLYDRAEQAEERNADLGGSRVYTTTEYDKLRRRFRATRAQLRTAIVQIKCLERCNVRELGRLEACWLAANDRWKAERARSEKAEATLAERDKRIATLEAAAQAVLAEYDALAAGLTSSRGWAIAAPAREALRAALEGKEAPRG